MRFRYLNFLINFILSAVIFFGLFFLICFGVTQFGGEVNVSKAVIAPVSLLCLITWLGCIFEWFLDGPLQY